MGTSACSARGVRLRCFAQLDKINMVDAIRAQIPLVYDHTKRGEASVCTRTATVQIGRIDQRPSAPFHHHLVILRRQGAA